MLRTIRMTSKARLKKNNMYTYRNCHNLYTIHITIRILSQYIDCHNRLSQDKADFHNLYIIRITIRITIRMLYALKFIPQFV